MNAIIYFSISKNECSKKVAEGLDGDLYRIWPRDRIYKSTFFQLLVYGFKTATNKPVYYEIDEIDFSKYDKVTLVSPVWAGRICQYMRSYLQTIPFKGKEVDIIGTSKGGYDKYFASYRGILDPSNKIQNEIMYVKGEKVI
jgi:hypothetical protein